MNISQVKSYLLEIKRLDALIRCKTAEIIQLRELAYSITPQSNSEPVTTSKNNDKIGSIVAKIVDLQNEKDISVDNMLDVKAERIAVIDKVHDPQQLELLHKRYVQYKSLKVIAIEMGISYDTARSTHGEALKSVRAILDKSTKKHKEPQHTTTL